MAISLLLQARGKLTAHRLATLLDVSVRTIYRDMNSLSLAHVPVSMDYGPGGGYFLSGEYRLEAAPFTGEEVAALGLASAIAGGTQLFSGGESVRQALIKLEATLPEEFRADIRAARERILLDVAGWHRRALPAPFLEPVRAAVWQGNVIDILYPRADGAGAVWRPVEPHGLVCKAGVWYLVAYCRLRRDFRTFRVGRIEDLVRREETFVPHADFDLATYWEEMRRHFEEMTAPLTVMFRVTGALLTCLDRAEVLRLDEADGSAVVRIDLESPDTAVSYALSLGPEGVVLEPPEIRAAVAQAAREMAARYDG
ncbi:MAG TPA: YafY family protein [Chloroflexota bacterium]|nr:YafY family protein [Chloroflexota bacterium]